MIIRLVIRHTVELFRLISGTKRELEAKIVKLEIKGESQEADIAGLKSIGGTQEVEIAALEIHRRYARSQS